MAKKIAMQNVPIATCGQFVVKEDNDSESLIHAHRGEQSIGRELHVWFSREILKKWAIDGAVVILRCETSVNGERRFSPFPTGNVLAIHF
jgi:hypothetical protein